MLPLIATALGAAGVTYLGAKYLTPWVFEDYKMIKKFKMSLDQYYKSAKENRFFIDIFESMVIKCPDKVMVRYEDELYTFKQINDRANQCAHAFLSQGVKPGDVVAMMMQNEPQFIWTYLGFLKIGVQLGFINFNQRHRTLIHSIKACEAQCLLVGEDPELENAVKEIQNEIANVKIYTYSSTLTIPNSTPLVPILEKTEDSPIDKSYRKGIKLTDASVYIFTSGTTGLPKAAIVTHDKTIKACFAMWASGVTGEDVLYEPLPLYHSAASLIGVGNVVTLGATMILKRKFSASQFLDDCRKYDVTIIHYVGELCRYLVSRPPRENDGDHKIKVAYGNGLRKDIWQELHTRFKIPVVTEFYGATEMPIGFINLTNKFGACGRLSPLLKMLIPVELVKYDMEEQDLVRNKKGFAVKAKIGEPGLLIIKLTNVKGVTFEGYKGRSEENQKKIFQDVFSKGDQYINTGDLFTVDKDYDLFFSDRVGDTFRWKGENVSTTEVANILGEVDFIMDACVFGVLIPGCEGRAGMAALILKSRGETTLTSDQLTAIIDHFKNNLGVYAWPRFIRVLKELEITSTYKQRKMTLVTEGFDPDKVKSTIYFLDCKTQMYKPMEKETYVDICSGKIAM